mmetsp:Transcript_26945/g.66040  ORF Transcript_26945/g.66040 Transcript_26945/m.66040 type:complete len:472 (+) Transcript_26945:92-1507(+)
MATMKKSSMALLALCLFTAAAVSAHAAEAEVGAMQSEAELEHSPAFLGFMSEHSKDYCAGRRSCQVSFIREKIYVLNKELIDTHNANPQRTFNMALSRFADLSAEEFERLHLKYRPSAAKVAAVGREVSQSTFASLPTPIRSRLGSSDDGDSSSEEEEDVSDLPNAFSWTDPPAGYGKVVAPVHDQQDVCASCWAFVTADSIGGRYAVMTKTDIEEMSVKQLMVCDQQDNGCNTGNMYTAYDWIDENGGMATKAAYNEAVPGGVEDDETATCSADVTKTLTTPGMCDLKMTSGNRALMLALQSAGPVAIGINANNLQFYSSGTIDSDSCPPAGRGIQSINHAALVVGWGEEDGKKYWLVKNSYGTGFGEDGFFKLERTAPSSETLFSTCGLLFESVYPVVVKVGDDDSNLEGQCVEGSVFKKDYYRNEDDNPGASGSATAEATAEADAMVAAAASAAMAEAAAEATGAVRR